MIIGAAVYMVLVGIIGMAPGGIMRNTAAGIPSLVALFFVIPPLMNLLFASWSDHIGPYLRTSGIDCNGGVRWPVHDGCARSVEPGRAVH